MVPCVTTFDFHGIALRVLKDTKADLWFAAPDACRGLGLAIDKTGAGHWLKALDGEERQTVRISSGIRGNPNVTFISESGLYKLVLRAQRSNPAARKFQDWVTKEVLPAIRKDGGYVMGEEKVRTGEMSEDQRRVVSRGTSRSRESRAVFATKDCKAVLIIEAGLLAISTGGSRTTTPCAEPADYREPLR